MLAKKRKKRKLNIFRLVLLLLLIAFLGAAGAVSVFVFDSIRDMPVFNPVNLKPIASSSIYDKDGKLITKLGPEYRVPVELNEIPPAVQDAFLAAEDHRFYQHFGIDFHAIARAAWENIRNQSIEEGGSTITQQLIKIAFLEPDRTFKRKIQEAILAIQLERHFSKQEILQMYLNRVYFGEGAYGIQAAARTYFNKKVGELKLHEAALLAGLPQAPGAYSPYKNPKAALARRNVVLKKMLDYSIISKKQYLEAVKQPLGVLQDTVPISQQYPYPYFVDYVTQQLIDEFGEDKVFKGGLNVYTTLDRKIQKAAEKALANPDHFPKSTKDEKGLIQPQGAAVVIDPNTGYIKAIVGGRKHTQKRVWNRATDMHRSPGSAFKPIMAYGPAIEYLGKAPASVVDDIPKTYPGYPEDYKPENFNHRHLGLITYREALRRSINVAAVEVLNTVGVPQALKFAQRLGISSFHPTEDRGLSLVLGGLHEGVTPLELAEAYACFANGGIHVEPTAILRVEGPDGTVLKEVIPQKVRVMKEATAYLITDMLKDVVSSGTGTRAKIDRPQAGKTGTSDENKDLWFAGYTPDLVGVVWVGYDEPTPMPGAFGGTYAAPIWAEIMKTALEDVPKSGFPRPPGIVTATVDSKSGLLPGPNTPEKDLVTDIFAKGTVPTEVDNVHVLVEVCATTGKLPTPYCPDRITKVMLKLPYTIPPKYADIVADYAERVPTEYCDVHTGPTWPGWPEERPRGEAETGSDSKEQNIGENGVESNNKSSERQDKQLPSPR